MEVKLPAVFDLAGRSVDFRGRLRRALDSGGAVTITLAACTTEGEVIILIGDDTGPVVINDTNLRSHDGAALSLGAYDVALLVCQDAEWIALLELATQ